MHCRTRKINPQVRPKPRTTVKTRPEASYTLQNHQEPYKTCQNYAKVAGTILERQYLSNTGHLNHAESNNIADLVKVIHRLGKNLPLPSKTDQKHKIPNTTIKSHIKPGTTMQL